MPTLPDQRDAYAEEIRRVYADAEQRLIEKVKKRLDKGLERPGWVESMLAQVHQVNNELSGEVGTLKDTDPRVEEILSRVYDDGAVDASDGLTVKAKALGQAPYSLGSVEADLTIVRGAAIRQLVAATVNVLDSTHFAVLRNAQDTYRSTIAQVTEQMAAGGLTPREAAQVALNRWADQGVTGFTDSAGRKWELSSYADMAIRSAMAQAAVQGHLDKLQAYDEDLVICSDSPEECELCRPWEGKVLSISGAWGHPSVSEAIAAGLFHPNCSHNLYLYTEGLTRPMQNTANPQGYANRQRQRANERQIRRWKRREAAAITDRDSALSHAKVREWQAKQRELISRTGRLREYGREQVRTGKVGVE